MSRTSRQSVAALEHPVRVARKARGWTQAQLAARARVSRNQVIRIELGHSSPRPATRACVARALSLPADELFA